MKLVKQLAMIAYAQSLDLEDATHFYRVDFERNKWGLFVNGACTKLFLISLHTSVRAPVPRGAAAQQKAFKKFTGFDVASAMSITVHESRTKLSDIGRANAIEYQSDKWTGEKTFYVHDYKTKVLVHADRRDLDKARVFGLVSSSGKKILSTRGLIL